MPTTGVVQSSGFLSGLSSPGVIRASGTTLSVVPGTFGDIISPTAVLAQPEVNAARCLLYLAVGYLLAR